MSIIRGSFVFLATIVVAAAVNAVDLSTSTPPSVPGSTKPAAPSPAARLLPSPILEMLNREYPGWTLARASKPVQDQFTKHQAGHPPSVMGGDFDGDGQKDYAVQISRTQPDEEEQIVIVFLKRADAFEEFVLESRGLDPDVYLWQRRLRRSDADAYPPNQRTQTLVQVMGGPAGESSYGYENGSFHEVSMPMETAPPYDGAVSP